MNPFGVFKCEHTKELCCFVYLSVSVKADWVNHFCDFVEATPTSTSPEIT